MSYPLMGPYLEIMVEHKASDIYLTVGYPPSLRVNDEVRPISEDRLELNDIEALLEEVLTPDQLAEFDSTMELNVALSHNDNERFRVNVFRQQGNTGIVIRHVSAEVPNVHQLNLPDGYVDAIMQKRGLVLMVGPTGSGKSTSLAAMVDYRNEHSAGHIITIEDPIEYVYNHKNCIVTQREIGIDTYSYGLALKNALRQSPDVLVIGEIRDRETLENALLFCETGHLVLATLHARNSVTAIERMLSFFPEDLKEKMLITLNQQLRYIFSQRLVQGIRGNRELAYEIMINEGLISVLIEEGKIKDIHEIIQKSVDRNMMTIDFSLLDLVKRGKVSDEVALYEADNPSNLRLQLNNLKQIRMHEDEDIMASFERGEDVIDEDEAPHEQYF